MDSYEKIEKEQGHIDLTALPVYFQSTSYIKVKSLEKDINRLITDFSKRNHINIRLVPPDGRGGGIGGGVGSFLYNLYQNKDILVFIYLVIKNLARISKMIIQDTKPRNPNEIKKPVIHLESNIIINTKHDHNINVSNSLVNFTNSITYLNALVSEVTAKFPLYEVGLYHNLVYMPDRSKVSYSQYGPMKDNAVQKLKMVIDKTLLAPYLASHFYTKNGFIVSRTDDYSWEYKGIHKKYTKYKIIPLSKDSLTKDIIKRIIIDWRVSKEYEGAEF